MPVVLIGTLDTKGAEIAYARDIFEDHSVDVHIVDAGVVGDPAVDGDTPREAVAEAGGTPLSALVDAGDRGVAVETMAGGAAEIAREMYEAGDLSGILSLGGSAGTTIGTTAMRALPFGVPKVMVSTMASGNTERYVGTADITMVNAVADIAGLNTITKRVISNAALATVGMVTNDVDVETEGMMTIAITMFGVTTPGVTVAREYLESQGYEVVVFHATGTGGRTMEELIDDGQIDGVLDYTTTELADELVGGILSAGSDRLESAGEVGIPQVVSTGALDMVNFGEYASVPKEFRDRNLHRHNPTATLMRTNTSENRRLGEVLAEKVNAADGPVTVGLPLRGVSLLDEEGEDFYDPEADRALFESIRTNLDEVPCIKMDAAINDEAFALRMARELESALEEQ